MIITTKHVQAAMPVTIMKLEGDLDAKWYQDVIVEVKELFDSGTRDLLVDMANLRFMASSGLVALHSAALIMRGEKPQDTSVSWSVFRTDHVRISSDSMLEEHCKLLNPSPRVLKTLELAGFNQVFEIFDDEEAALSSFG
ncbi:MAG: STAS domain-containing protein [Candidatus Promineifilaceae bacterium]